MKEYLITGYLMPKGQEEKGWQKINDNTKIKLPDNLNVYEIVAQNFKIAASHWLFIAEELIVEE